MMKYHTITPSRWHYLVIWTIHTVIGMSIANDETDMRIERSIQRSKRLRRMAFRDCADSRKELRHER